MGYEKCYLYLRKRDQFIKIAFLVDDGMVAQKGEQIWDEYLQAIQKRFSMKYEDLEKRTKFLGNNFHLNRERNYCLIEQSASIDKMQTRMELYDVLGYQAYEDKLDELFKEQGITKE